MLIINQRFSEVVMMGYTLALFSSTNAFHTYEYTSEIPSKFKAEHHQQANQR